jgi:hypothetical protein
MSQAGDQTQRHILHLGTPLFEAPNRRAAKVAYLLAGALVDVVGTARRGFVPVRTASGATGFVRTTALQPGPGPASNEI